MRPLVVSCSLLSMSIGVGSAQESAPVVQDYVVEAIIDVPGSSRTRVFGINSQGWVAGRYDVGPECAQIARDSTQISFVWKKGTFEDLSFPGALSTRADNVNDRGFVSGSFRADNCGRARDGFVMTPHGEFLTVSFPVSSIHDVVNNITPSGWMVGPYVDSGCVVEIGIPSADGCVHGFLFNGSQFHTLDPPGSVLTDAHDINPRRDVIGSYDDASGTHGFLFSFRKGTYETIDFPGATSTVLWGINAAGRIAGLARNFAERFGFIYERGQFTEINLVAAEPFVLHGAFGLMDINGKGTIVGNLFGADGKQRGYIARPVK